MAPKTYLSNGLGAFESSKSSQTLHIYWFSLFRDLQKLPNLTYIMVWVILTPQKVAKRYVYNGLGDLDTSKTFQTLRISWLGSF